MVCQFFGLLLAKIQTPHKGAIYCCYRNDAAAWCQQGKKLSWWDICDSCCNWEYPNHVGYPASDSGSFPSWLAWLAQMDGILHPEPKCSATRGIFYKNPKSPTQRWAETGTKFIAVHYDNKPNHTYSTKIRLFQWICEVSKNIESFSLFEEKISNLTARVIYQIPQIVISKHLTKHFCCFWDKKLPFLDLKR